TRQLVSKWESGQSVPDAERLVKLSELFGVSVDFLLKGDGSPAGDAPPAASAARLVTAGEAADYLALRGRAAGRIAAGTCLCILSPVCLLLLAAMSDAGGAALSETAAAGYGLAALLVLVAGAVALFIHCGLQSAPYRYLDEPFTLEQAAAELVRGRLEAGKRAYGRKCVAGGVLCVLAALPLLLTAILTGGDALAVVASLCGTLLLAGAGSALFILAGVPRAAAERLLQIGEYTREAKRKGALLEVFSSVYWLAATAVYLLLSFRNGWDRSWMLWPVAGVIFAALYALLEALTGRKK
ncbi:MAG: helix-turn-helix transcriptional regulator, partial [Clostridiales bacterium]|nr:helix-turn-helix transcriptional regulator [Clostridiales bacterium]